MSLAHLAPFVDISRKSIRKEVIKERKANGDDLDESKIERTVKSRLAKEITKGIQTIQYQIITLMTTNGQAPFITIFMYLNEAKNEQEKEDLALLIQEFLVQTYEGVKDETGEFVTPAFPKIIYVTQEDNINPGDRFYYLTQLAAMCSIKRLTPDYISEKVMKELKRDVFACMGCRSFLSTYNDENGNPKYYGRLTTPKVKPTLNDVNAMAKAV